MKADKVNITGETRLTGKVVIKKFAGGSKSEHDAVCLETTGASYVLKRMGGNPFNDAVLNKLVGKKITATGTIDQYQFLVTDIEED